MKYLMIVLCMVCGCVMGADTCADALDAIHWAESRRGKTSIPLYPHPDGTSWGEYGVTYGAVKELQRVGIIRRATMAVSACEAIVLSGTEGRYSIQFQTNFLLFAVGDETVVIPGTEVDLSDPVINRLAAESYLRLMHRRHGCGSWLEAAGWYHGGNIIRRRNYIERLDSRERNRPVACQISFQYLLMVSDTTAKAHTLPGITLTTNTKDRRYA